MKKSIREQFKEIASNYKGDIKEDEDRLWIENKNVITSYYKEGGICRQERVLCKVGIWGKGLFAEEKTCSILGDALLCDFSPDVFIHYLKKYGFEEEKVKQISFW